MKAKERNCLDCEVAKRPGWIGNCGSCPTVDKMTENPMGKATPLRSLVWDFVGIKVGRGKEWMSAVRRGSVFRCRWVRARARASRGTKRQTEFTGSGRTATPAALVRKGRVARRGAWRCARARSLVLGHPGGPGKGWFSQSRRPRKG